MKKENESIKKVLRMETHQYLGTVTVELIKKRKYYSLRWAVNMAPECEHELRKLMEKNGEIERVMRSIKTRIGGEPQYIKSNFHGAYGELYGVLGPLSENTATYNYYPLLSAFTQCLEKMDKEYDERWLKSV